MEAAVAVCVAQPRVDGLRCRMARLVLSSDDTGTQLDASYERQVRRGECRWAACSLAAVVAAGRARLVVENEHGDSLGWVSAAASGLLGKGWTFVELDLAGAAAGPLRLTCALLAAGEGEASDESVPGTAVPPPDDWDPPFEDGDALLRALRPTSAAPVVQATPPRPSTHAAGSPAAAALLELALRSAPRHGAARVPGTGIAPAGAASAAAGAVLASLQHPATPSPAAGGGPRHPLATPAYGTWQGTPGWAPAARRAAADSEAWLRSAAAGPASRAPAGSDVRVYGSGRSHRVAVDACPASGTGRRGDACVPFVWPPPITPLPWPGPDTPLPADAEPGARRRAAEPSAPPVPPESLLGPLPSWARELLS